MSTSHDAVKIDMTKKSTKKSKVHLLPFSIDFSGPAKVSSYFESTIFPDKKEGLMKASFRGNPLNGHEVDLPKGYVGVFVKEGEPKAHLIPKSTFSSVTSWKWDQNPKSHDEFKDSLDWIDISGAIHSLK
jgi:hypothetical protein